MMKERALDRYPNISDHGLIGDLQTSALVTTDGTVDFFCCPRFDSPSVFASLLDAEKGGYFRIAPAGDNYVTKQLYMPGSAMLITRFMTPDGVGEVLDFMPVIEGKPTDRHRLVRRLRVARGTMQFVMDLQPRFDYGRARHTIEASEAGAVFRSDNGMELTLHSTGKRKEAEAGPAVERAGDGLHATFTMREGESGLGVVLESMGGSPKKLSPGELDRLAEDTEALLEGLAGPLHLHRALAGNGRPVGDDAQADDLRADWRAGGRRDVRPARASRRRAELGLPVHLDPGRIPDDACPGRPGLPGGSGQVRRLAPGPRHREPAPATGHRR